MPKISCIIPTVRDVSLNEKCLARQTFRDFETVVVRPDGTKTPDLVWTFNRDVNRGIKQARGELIVFYQDLIWIEPDGLERFWFWYEKNGGCTTGVGNIYDRQDERGMPINQVWSDPRINDKHGSYYECMPQDWEMNWCSAPKKALYAIGGFNEEMDKLYGMDNVEVALRMDKVGYKFYIDQTNVCRGLKHDRPADWDAKHWMNHGFYEMEHKIHLDYLGEVL